MGSGCLRLGSEEADVLDVVFERAELEAALETKPEPVVDVLGPSSASVSAPSCSSW